MLYTSPFFLSIAGAPASGKSYFLTSMIWRLRKIFARDFCLSFTDADATMNKRIREYESIQFLGSDPNKIVAIEKTEAQGDIYNLTRVSGQEVFLAQPFTFAISPMPNYPSPETGASIGQTVCFYDNAGESFLPGSDHASQPVTRHLATSDAILFLFDPTQDPRFQKACTKAVEDPQMNPTLGGQVRRSEVRQETVLTEMITRIRAHARLSAQAKHKAPLVIVLTKVDAWRQLANFDLSSNPWNPTQGSPVHTYNPRRVEEFSQILRKLLIQLIPDLVSTAESFARHVTYIAVSATGGPPSVDSNTGAIGFRSGKIRPVWTEVPFFQAQALANKSCFPTLKTKSP